MSHQQTFDSKIVAIDQIPLRSNAVFASMKLLELGALLISCGIAIFCIGFFLYTSAPWLRFPADTLSWSETDFMGGVIKLQVGAPYYTPPQDSNSGVYTPVAPWLSVVLLTILHVPVSVPALRTLQLVFVLLATFVAAYNVRVMRRIVAPDLKVSHPLLWTFLGILLLFLAATSPQVNWTVLTLHVDALALLMSMVFWWTLLEFIRKPETKRLLILALMPALGFAVKPFLLSWLPVTAVVLAILPFKQLGRHVRMWLIYMVAASAAAAGMMLLFYIWWGNDFLFWVFQVMGGTRKHITLTGVSNVALGRSVDHLLRAWWEFAVGTIAGWFLLHRAPDRRMAAVFTGWLVLIGFEALTSGVAFHALYHFGPGVLFGATWLVTALPLRFPMSEETQVATPSKLWNSLNRATIFVVTIVSVCLALHVFPSRDRSAPRWFPGRLPPAELYSQIKSIEGEFEGYNQREVLLDVGNWIYLKSGTVAKDRAVALADQPLGGHYENFEPFIERIRNVQYKKILMRDFYAPKFLYDHWLWSHRSGVKEALLEHYKEIRTIPAVEDVPAMVFGGPITVFIPKDSNSN
jgi:hypothetical protein